MAIRISNDGHDVGDCECGAADSHFCENAGGVWLTPNRGVPGPRSPIAVNAIALDIFSGERADVPPPAKEKVAVNAASFPQLTAQQAEICTRMHISQSEFLEAQARYRAGKHPLSDTTLGGGGDKRSVGPVAATGFKAR